MIKNKYDEILIDFFPNLNINKNKIKNIFKPQLNRLNNE